MPRALWPLHVLAIVAVAISPRQAAAQDSTVTLVGSVVDSVGGQPIPYVEVYVPDGTTSRTGRDGHFKLSGVPRRNPLAFARRIGYRRRAIDVNPGESESQVDLGIIRLSPIYFALDTIRVEADLVRTNPKLSEFYRRRKAGMGQYLTLSEIQKRNPFATTDLLRTIPGVGVRCTSGPCTPVTYRRSQPCPMRLILDGVPVRDFELDMIPPNWIAGIEIYRSLARTPLELGRSSCGTVVVWTGGER